MITATHTRDTVWQGRLYMLVAAGLLLKCVPASLLCFGNDEVYYLNYARRLDWNYFDHPPMIALVIRVFSLNLNAMYEGLIRLSSMVAAAASTCILFNLVQAMHSARAAFYAALLFSFSFYTAVIAGFMVMPDGVQVLFWISALYFLHQAFKNPYNLVYWSGAGIATGLCIMSKVHGVFLLGGAGLFALAFHRVWLAKPGFWLFCLLGITLASPIYFWNLQHDFVTYRFHGSRVSVGHFKINFLAFFREVLGEILYNNPMNFTVTVASVIYSLKNRKKPVSFDDLLRCTAIPMIAVLVVISLFRETLPHWSGPAYLTLMPLAAIFLTDLDDSRARLILRVSGGLFGFAFLTIFLVIECWPGTLGKQNAGRLGEGDITLDMYGWKDAGLQFGRFLKNRPVFLMGAEPKVMVCNKWFPASHEAFYLGRPAGLYMVGLGNINDLHQYYWLNEMLPADLDMGKAYLVVPSNMPGNPAGDYSDYYSKIDSAGSFTVERSGKPCRSFSVYILSQWKGVIPLWSNQASRPATRK